jgi:phage tail-like protein
MSIAEPLLNAQFRVEIEGLPASGVVEVILPEARIIPGRGKIRIVQYGALTLRRGMTRSSDWYRWWDSGRRASGSATRRITIALMDRTQADAARWTFSEARPSAYAVSPLNALRGEPLIETLELVVSGMSVSF